MIHGEKQTIRTRVGGDKVYTKNVRFCLIHGWIDTFMCGDFDRAHGGCGADDTKPVGVGKDLPKARGAAA